MANTLNISKKYLRFFVKNTDSRWILIQGGRRSGKSFSVIQWLWFLASATPNSIVMMVAASYPALQLLMSDFQRATPLRISGSLTEGYNCTLSNGSKFLFRSFDTYEKAQGSTCDYLYLEEALNIPIDVITTLSMSVTRQIFACYNPTKSSEIDRYILPDNSNHIVTTFKDNDYLTQAQREEFEEIKRRAMKPTASILDIYAYTVYYKGDYSNMSGKVFPIVYSCEDDEYDRIPSRELYGLDFGFTSGGDKTAMVGVKVHNHCIYVKEYIYSDELFNDRQLAFALHNLGLNECVDIIADYGGSGRQRIHNLVTAGDGEWTEPEICRGFSVSNAKKGKVVDGLRTLLNYDKIILTESSTNLRKELDNYELKPSGEPKGEDHLVDAMRYASNSYSIFCC